MTAFLCVDEVCVHDIGYIFPPMIPEFEMLTDIDKDNRKTSSVTLVYLCNRG